MHFVYIVRCADGTFYTGYARDPKARLKMHNAGAGAKYTRGRRPVKLVYCELCESLSHALKREYEVKQWPRAKKRRLVGNANGQALAERRDGARRPTVSAGRRRAS